MGTHPIFESDFDCLTEFFLASLLPAAGYGAYCHGGPKPDAAPNSKPILMAPPKFVRESTNARLYEVDTGNNKVSILHVWGSAYEMGFAHGRLMKEEVTTFLTAVYDYMIDEITHEINDFAPNLPEDFFKDVAEHGIDWALDMSRQDHQPNCTLHTILLQHRNSRLGELQDTLRKTFERNGFTVVKKVNYEKAFGAAHYNGKLASPCCYFMVKALV